MGVQITLGNIAFNSFGYIPISGQGLLFNVKISVDLYLIGVLLMVSRPFQILSEICHLTSQELHLGTPGLGDLSGMSSSKSNDSVRIS